METSKLEGIWWGLVIVPFISGVLSALFWETLRDNEILCKPLIVVFFFISFFVWHILVAFRFKINDERKEKSRRINSWVSGVLIFICLILVIKNFVNPEINTFLMNYLYSEEELVEVVSGSQGDTSEENGDESGEINDDEEHNLSTIWFIDNCFPEPWNVFNIDSDVNNGCKYFNEINIESNEGGFNIKHLENIGSRFLIFRPVDRSISKISFSVYIEKITTSMISLPNVFYFGYISTDPTLIYGSTTQTPPDVAFDGEYVLFTGFGDEKTNGIIRIGNNPSEIFDRISTDVDFRHNHIYQVEIELIGNYWNVNIKDMTELRPEFTRSNLNSKGNIFAFGFKIPQDGMTNLRIFDLKVE